MSSKLKRLFIAAPLTTETISRFAEWKKQAGYHPLLRYLPDINLHITLCFMGDTPADLLPQITGRLRKLASETSSVKVNFDRYCLAPARNPYMIWAKFESNPDFTALFFRVHEAMEMNIAKIKPVPHVTLARYKGVLAIDPELLSVSSGIGAITLDRLILFESVLLPDGAKYIESGIFMLKQA